MTWTNSEGNWTNNLENPLQITALLSEIMQTMERLSEIMQTMERLSEIIYMREQLSVCDRIIVIGLRRDGLGVTSRTTSFYP